MSLLSPLCFLIFSYFDGTCTTVGHYLGVRSLQTPSGRKSKVGLARWFRVTDLTPDSNAVCVTEINGQG
jgi:hypothetical protein